MARLARRPGTAGAHPAPVPGAAGAAAKTAIEAAGDELFLFSSDYPHPEGGRDPIGRFQRSLEDTPAEARERFCWRNFEHMMGGAA